MRRKHVPVAVPQAERRDFLRKMGWMSAGVSLASFYASPAWAAEDCSDPNYNPPDYPQDCKAPAATGQPVPFTPLQGPVLPRKSAFELTPEEITKIQSAYRALRELTVKDPTDPRGWQQQSFVHCWYCGGGSDGQQGMEIHGSWWFLPWHRAFLYFHERILGGLINDPTFRLPFWDWDTQSGSPSHQTMPPIYTAILKELNPLSNTRRGETATARIPSSIVGPTVIARILGQSTYATFGGAGNNGQPGQLEQGPHNQVHVWTGTGKTTMPDCGTDMGVLATAARDPLFFAHHSNVDRFWDLWKQIPGHDNPPDDSWLSQTWTFYDEQKRFVSIAVKDVITTAGLGYEYAPVKGVAKAVAAKKAPPAATTVAAAASTGSAPEPLVVTSKDEGISLTPKPVTHSVQSLPKPQKDRMMAITPGAKQRVLLKIQGIEIPMTESAQVRVFVNKPDATAATSVETPNFAGNIGAVAHTRGKQHQNHAKTFDATIELAPETARLIATQGKVSVTLVPVDAMGKQPKDISLKYRKIVLETE
ncbi:tyrosinase family protein [Hyalangium versicolor]|uniref:tyrosinase family protein n=1 Tax=Hyalangium versicolor TaxID=2861190 RepID=UPI001CCBB993|nr:tyrosinase family protein [Hyalangium versicolor]